MRTWFLIGIVGIVCFVSACSSTFTLAKNPRGAHLHGNSKDKYDMLCASGDLKKVLASSQLSKEIKDDLYKYNCSDERSGKKVKQIYDSMTAQERLALKNAFRKEGYTINYRPC